MTNSHFTFTIRTLAHIPHMHSILSPHIYNTPHTLTSHTLLTTLLISQQSMEIHSSHSHTPHTPHQSTVDGDPLLCPLPCCSSPLQSLRPCQVNKVELGPQSLPVIRLIGRVVGGVTTTLRRQGNLQISKEYKVLL